MPNNNTLRKFVSEGTLLVTMETRGFHRLLIQWCSDECIVESKWVYFIETGSEPWKPPMWKRPVIDSRMTFEWEMVWPLWTTSTFCGCAAQWLFVKWDPHFNLCWTSWTQKLKYWFGRSAAILIELVYCYIEIPYSIDSMSILHEHTLQYY